VTVAPTADQLYLHDQAMTTWAQNNFVIEGRTTQLLFATPRRAFVEVTTGQVVDNRTLKLPRVSVQRLDSLNDPSRYNSNRIRHLGWLNPPLKRQKIGASYPVPIVLPYQIDLWTSWSKDMNLWEQMLLSQFASGYTYQSIRPDDVWRDKSYIVFLDGGIVNNSDLEPGTEGERQIRKTVNLRAECRIYPTDYSKNYVVKRAEAAWIDKDDGVTEYDRSYLPPLESLGTGDGSTVVFSGTLDRPPVLPHTAVIQTVISGTTEVVNDDGSGNWDLSGRVSAGSIDYVSGAWAITFSAPPDAAVSITITYFTDLS
jgi:hypothetical protein